MKVAKSLLLGSAAVLATVAGAQAADLPTRKAAPVQYVKICDAYGAGFFYIPGTDTCLRVGGLVLADWAVSNTPAKQSLTPTATTLAAIAAGGGAVPATWTPGGSRDAVANTALGRLELDARTQSPWGTVRTFIRVDSVFGSGATANTGALSNTILGLPATTTGALGTQAAKDVTFLNKAFIQFAGITMGRIQSMFDFYADAVGYTPLRGSNQTANAIAYTLTMGGGFSATLAVEDAVSHRGAGSVPAVINQAAIPAWGAAQVNNQFTGTRMPDVVANLRLDQPWGSAQISGALHRVGQGLWNNAAVALNGVTVPLNAPMVVSNSLGFAVQGGVMFKLDMLAPGDVLWLQATYAKGAIGYVDGSNFAYVNGVDTSNNYGPGLARVSSGNGWNQYVDADCVWSQNLTCDKSSAWAITAALRHYWTPTISSTLSGNYYQVSYSSATVNNAQFATPAGAFVTGITNYKEITLATGLEWNPIKNFGIGAEVAWQHGVSSKPVGIASDAALMLAGLPAFKSSGDLVRGRVRMYRAF